MMCPGAGSKRLCAGKFRDFQREAAKMAKPLFAKRVTGELA